MGSNGCSTRMLVLCGKTAAEQKKKRSCEQSSVVFCLCVTG